MKQSWNGNEYIGLPSSWMDSVAFFPPVVIDKERFGARLISALFPTCHDGATRKT
jgi:hypothetical protein